MEAAFKDASIFMGWREWHDGNGQWYRAEYKGGQKWFVYKEINESAYVFHEVVRAGKICGCRLLWNLLTEQEARHG